MSTRPYATHGGLRIRQCYNKAVIRYRSWHRTRQPCGANHDEWFRWIGWVRQREEQMLADRNKLIADAEAEHRRTRRYGTTPKRRSGTAASPAAYYGDSRGA